MATPLVISDLNNIQGDILEGLPKKGEIFFFFQIDERRVKDFCTQLLELTPLITSATQVRNDRERIRLEKKRAADAHTNPVILDMSAVNIAFSQKGLQALGIRDPINDTGFENGMINDVDFLRDNIDKWKDAFKEEIHGVILVTGSSHPTIEKKLASVLKIFRVGQSGTTISPVYQVEGHTRPGDVSHHEHFGFADGISQPTIATLPADPNVPEAPNTEPPEEFVLPGAVLLGREGDVSEDRRNRQPVKRPLWAKDGSFLCFRQLKQRVPEFDQFLETNKSLVGGDKELLGARLVGRWKSGAPVDLSEFEDNLELARDPARNNNFRYDPLSQSRCPFAAHTRKTYPRSDLEQVGANSRFNRIFRRGIQYGPEVTEEEAIAKKSSPSPKLERGLLFACYQSNLGNGFRFMQHDWVSEPSFPPKSGITPGFDPIVGVSGIGEPRTMVGHIPTVSEESLDLTTDVWVVPRGGEYFFSPSISALQETFAQAA